jgi:beta-lactam-binding protein with PASTA domain
MRTHILFSGLLSLAVVACSVAPESSEGSSAPAVVAAAAAAAAAAGVVASQVIQESPTVGLAGDADQPGAEDAAAPAESPTDASDDLRIIDDSDAPADIEAPPVTEVPVDADAPGDSETPLEADTSADDGTIAPEIDTLPPTLPDPPTGTEAMPATVAQAAAASGAVAGQATEVIPAIPTASLGGAEADPTGELFDDEPRSKRRRGPVILLVLLLLAGLGALAYAGSVLLETKSFEVPVLAGVSENEAMNQIVGNDWLVSTSGERSDTFPEPDTVIRTDPGPGVELEEGEPFTLVLSEGPEFRILPEIAALPFDAAVAQLAGLGLSGLEAPAREFSETVAVESVIFWKVQGDAAGDMQAGANILPGETIVMTLSKGPTPRTVPNVIGQTLVLASEAATELQLVIVEGDAVFSEDVGVGVIVNQRPEQGAKLAREGTITVQVSKGIDRIEFPDLEGLTFSEAQTLLLEIGFTIGNLLGTTDGVFVEATVGDVEILPGDMLRRGRAIDLIFL